MASTYKDFELLSPVNFQLTATSSLVFSATSSAEIVSIEMHNASVSNYWFKVYYPLTASLASDSGSYERISETLVAGATLEYKRTPLILKNGQGIYATAQNSASINISIFGRVV